MADGSSGERWSDEADAWGARGSEPEQHGDNRTPVRQTGGYRFAKDLPDEKTIPEQTYENYVLEYGGDDAGPSGETPDVLLDVPLIKVDEVNFELEDMRARVSLQAEVLDLMKLNVGVDAYLSQVRLDVEGVEAQALLKVRLDNVTPILDRVLTTIDRNPQIIERLVEDASSAVEDVGRGAGSAVEGAGQTAEDVSRAAQQAGVVLQGDGLLGETVNDQGRIVQRTLDESGTILETTLDKDGGVLEETLAGSLDDFQIEDEYIDESGNVVRRMSDESGNTVEQTADEEENTVGLSVLRGGDAVY